MKYGRENPILYGDVASELGSFNGTVYDAIQSSIDVPEMDNVYHYLPDFDDYKLDKGRIFYG